MDILDPRAQPLQTFNLSLQGRQSRSHPLRILLVVPEIGNGHLLLEVRYLRFLSLGIENILNRGQGCVEVLNGLLKVYQCHVEQLYRDVATTPVR